MGTLLDYLDWRGDLTFREAPLNEVDGLLFSIISYLDMVGIVHDGHSEDAVSLRSALNAFFARNPQAKRVPLGLLFSKQILVLARKLKDTRRFRNVLVGAHVNKIDKKLQMQFSATTFYLGNGSALVAFRGTDDSLIGWKEDLNMSFLPVIPAQLAAVNYLREVAKAYGGSLILTGHSKGGNLAVYSAVHSDAHIRSHVREVYCYDGPGFGKCILNDPIYLEMRPLIRSFVPQASVVGMLLEHDNNYTVIKSRQSGLLQHDGLSWELMGGSFVQAEKLSAGSRRTDQTLNQWIRDMSRKQREELVEAVYQLFAVEGVSTVSDLIAMRKDWIQHSKRLDPGVHRSVQRIFSDLIALTAKSRFAGLLPKKGTPNGKFVEKKD